MLKSKINWILAQPPGGGGGGASFGTSGLESWIASNIIPIGFIIAGTCVAFLIFGKHDFANALLKVVGFLLGMAFVGIGFSGNAAEVTEALGNLFLG